MLLYNVTIIIEEESANEFLTWIEKEHIPAVMGTGKFISHRLLKVVDSPNEGVTYCTQFIAENRAAYDEYLSENSTALQSSLPPQFENKFVIFPTLMEFVSS